METVNCKHPRAEWGYGYAAGPLGAYRMCVDCSAVVEFKADDEGCDCQPVMVVCNSDDAKQMIDRLTPGSVQALPEYKPICGLVMPGDKRPDLNAAPQALTKAHRVRAQLQYYYATAHCPAENANDSDCTCWHDEGGGPYPDARFSNSEGCMFEWREKPCASQQVQQVASVPTTIAPPDWLESEYPNGMTQQDVHNELHDYKILLDNVPSVYEHVTGGMTSNPMVLAHEVIALADDWANESYQDGVSDTRDELVPDGYILVPIEPTIEMKSRAWDYMENCARTKLPGYPDAGGIYVAMLAAAPSPTGLDNPEAPK